MRKIICILITLLNVFYVSAQDSSWEAAFSILDEVEINLNALQNSNEMLQSENADLLNLVNETTLLLNDFETIMTEQDNLLSQWGVSWDEMMSLYQQQQNSLERLERRCKIFKITIIISVPIAAISTGLLVWGATK